MLLRQSQTDSPHVHLRMRTELCLEPSTMWTTLRRSRSCPRAPRILHPLTAAPQMPTGRAGSTVPLCLGLYRRTPAGHVLHEMTQSIHSLRAGSAPPHTAAPQARQARRTHDAASLQQAHGAERRGERPKNAFLWEKAPMCLTTFCC